VRATDTRHGFTFEHFRIHATGSQKPHLILRHPSSG